MTRKLLILLSRQIKPKLLTLWLLLNLNLITPLPRKIQQPISALMLLTPLLVT
ncbi:DUF1145 domain-containing protein [Escherichia coli]|nr:DUF1145 domain-containing protein [Escherichia coli]